MKEESGRTLSPALFHISCYLCCSVVTCLVLCIVCV